MSSLGELRPVADGEHKVEIRSAVIKLHVSEGDDHLPIDKMLVMIDGGDAVALQMFTVGKKSDHVIFAVEIPTGDPLYFVAYKLVGEVWQQQGNVVIDPRGNLRVVVKEGVYDPIKIVHRHFLRCCS